MQEDLAEFSVKDGLAEIEKAEPLVKNIALQAIQACEDGLKVEFRPK